MAKCGAAENTPDMAIANECDAPKPVETLEMLLYKLASESLSRKMGSFKLNVAFDVDGAVSKAQ